MKRKTIVLCMIILLFAGCGTDDSIVTTEEVSNIDESNKYDYITTTNHEEAISVKEEENTMYGDLEWEEIEVDEYAQRCRKFSDGVAWVCKYDDSWSLIDTNGRVIYTLPIEWGPVTDFMNGICLIGPNGRKGVLKIIDVNGKEVLKNCLDENDIIICMDKMGDKVNIWVKSTVDTYNSHSVKLRVIDEKGSLKADFSPEENSYIDDLSWDDSDFRSIGDDVYIYHEMVFDVNTQAMYTLGSWGANPLNLKFNENYGSDNTHNGNLIDRFGNVILQGEGGYERGVFGDGMSFFGYQPIYYDYNFIGGFLMNGNMIIDLSDKLVMGLPYFKDGYCLLQIVNEAGVEFVTVMDKEGIFYLNLLRV